MDDTRTANILIRATPEEKKKIEDRAQAMGLNVSEFMRMVALTVKVTVKVNKNNG